MRLVRERGKGRKQKILSKSLRGIIVCVQIDSSIKDMERQMQKENWDPGPNIKEKRMQTARI